MKKLQHPAHSGLALRPFGPDPAFPLAMAVAAPLPVPVQRDLPTRAAAGPGVDALTPGLRQRIAAASGLPLIGTLLQTRR